MLKNHALSLPEGKGAAAWTGGAYERVSVRARREERKGLAHLEECDLCCAPEGGQEARTPLAAFFNALVNRTQRFCGHRRGSGVPHAIGSLLPGPLLPDHGPFE